jgi:hypothetical protein
MRALSGDPAQAKPHSPHPTANAATEHRAREPDDAFPAALPALVQLLARQVVQEALAGTLPSIEEERS